MSEFILHHYPMSPFSEKIRAMLGYAQLDWRSVETSPMPPRPILTKIIGGYRRIPVAQCGADIFCDTRTIAGEIARRSGLPLLALENCSDDIQVLVIEAEVKMIFACVMAANTKALRRQVRNQLSWMDIARLLLDRIQMFRRSSIKVNGLHDARVKVLRHLSMLDELLKTDPFLLGNEPTHGDFAAYHGLWFLREQAQSPLLLDFSHVCGWMDRISQFGHGQNRTMTGEEALKNIQIATPRPIAPEFQSDPLIGQLVQIAPSDYAQIATQGILAGRTHTEWILARQEPSLGTIHVHFPITGYAIVPNPPHPLNK